MPLTSTRSRVAAGVITIAAAATPLAPPVPAQADYQPAVDRVRVRAVSAYDPAPAKDATVTCPAGSAVLGAGGQITNGAGGVLLTAAVPDPTLTSVTARGAALPGHDQDWSVAALAVCGRPPAFQTLVRSDPTSTTASCPSPVPALIGTGFELPSPAGSMLLTGLVPAPAAGTVTVLAWPLTTPARANPTSYAICAVASSSRRSASSPTDPVSPKVVTVYSPAPVVTGVGGRVTGPVTDVFIDALVPAPGLAGAGVRASRLEVAGARVGVAGPSSEDESWSLTGYAIETADYY